MSEKSKMKRASREEKQKKQGENIVKWIFIALVVLAIIFMIVSINAMS